MKTPKYKINVLEICAALNKCGLKIPDRKSFYRSNGIHGELDGITLDPARGQCYEETITSFTLYVGRVRGRRVICYHSEKIEGSDWLAKLPGACGRIIQKAREFAAIEATRRDNHHRAYEARKAYAEELNKVLPPEQQISEWNLLTKEGKMPAGYRLSIPLLGTAEAVAARIKKVLETI